MTDEPQELPNDSQRMAVALAGADRRILELGCSAGHVTRRLVENGCTVTGVEIDPTMAEEARQFADEVLVADLDDVLPTELIGQRRFDAIVVGDVFEHLKRPVAVLADLAELLEPGGHLVTSIPNVTHADVRLMLLSGRWRYQDDGLLDRTHLRFFDAEGVDDLFAAAGWTPTRVERTTKEPFHSELAHLLDSDSFASSTIDDAVDGSDSRTYQFVVVAVPSSSTTEAPVLVAPDTSEQSAGGAVERLFTENERLRSRARELEAELDAVRWQLAKVEARPARRVERAAGRIVRGVKGRVTRSADR